MAKTIEQRVVEMKFDNKNFEKNVKQTMSTLDKLKSKLNLNGAAKGLANVEAQSKKLNFSGISSAIDTASNKFSALEIAGMTALAKITNAAINAGTALVKSLSLDQVMAGFDKFGKKTTSVSTLRAQGFAMEEVNEQLDRLNWFTDETSYNYTDMVDNISKFTATGKGLTESVQAMQGIANWAALSGQNAEKASSAMYQLSQALSAGYMRREDYKSIQNVNMDTAEFRQKALDAAVALGTVKKNSDGTYKSLKATGKAAANFTVSQFAETLTDGQWFTADVMMKVFGEYSKAVDEIYKVTEEKGMLASEVIDEIHEKAKTEGITTNEAIKALGYNFDEFALKAFEAAQKARTFGDAIDATRDAVSTSWMKTFEIIFGDAEEATELWTDLANALWDVFASGGEARNEMLKGWKALGGRDDLIQSFWNTWEAIASVIRPIKEAFRDIFPKKTAEQLFNFTKKLKEFTAGLAISEKSAKRLKSAFKALFSIIDIMWTVMSSFWKAVIKIYSAIFEFSVKLFIANTSISDFIVRLRDSIKEGNIFARYFEWLTNVVIGAIDKIKEFGKSLKESFKEQGYKGFVGLLKGIYDLLVKIGKAIENAFGGVGKAVAAAFNKNGMTEVLNSGLFSAVLVGLYKFIDNINKPLSSLSKFMNKLVGRKGIISNFTEALESLQGCLEAYQSQLEAKTLIRIAAAIGILAGSILLISTIEPEALGRALGGLTVLFAELFGSLALFSKIPSLKGAWRAIPLMISISTSLLILSAALKVVGSLEFGEMITALIGVAGGMGILIGALRLLPEKMVNKAAKAIRTLSFSMLILSAALKIMGSMSWGEVGRSLVATAGGLALMVAAVRFLPKSTAFKTLGLIALASSLNVLAVALKVMGTMSWDEIGRSLVVFAGALAAIVVALNLMPNGVGVLAKSMGLVAIASSLNILAVALKVMGGMQWDEIKRGLTALGGALIILSLGLKAMKSTTFASASLLIMTTALMGLTVVLRLLGSMKIETIIVGLVALAGAFTVLGVAGLLLKRLVLPMLTLAGSFALIGISALALGAGLVLIGTGIASVAASLAAGATTIIASLTVIITGILNLIPTIASKIAEGIATFAQVIGTSAPILADSALKLIAEVLKSIAEYTPVIAGALFDLLIGIIDVLATKMPELVAAMARLLDGLFVGVAESLKDFDGANLLKGAVVVAIMTGLTYALASVGSSVGPAMLGLLGVGALIAELTLVLAAIGALTKIPGLMDFIDSGGYVLQAVGTALGQFIGGLVGGIAKGFTSSLPKIGDNLSEFMENAGTFIKGAADIDESMLCKIKALVKSIKTISNEGSLADIGKQLVPFGKGMKEYSGVVKDLDTNSIINSASAAKAIVDVANVIPNSGGLAALFAGDNDIKEFSEKIVPFGEGLVEYSKAVDGIKHTAIIESANAARVLAEMTQTIPNSGGIAAWFAGENSVSKFAFDLKKLGKGLKNFSDETADITPENIKASADAAKSLAEMTKVIPNEGGMSVWFAGENSVAKFSDDLVFLGKGLKLFADETALIIPENIKAAADAAKALAEMTNHIPNEGGCAAFFAGDNSVANFAPQLPKLGAGLKGFSDKIDGIVPENIKAAADAAKALAEMSTYIPNEGGCSAFFAGENSVAKFGPQLPKLGEGLRGFSDKIDGIVPENITAAASAAKALAEMTTYIPNEGGIVAFFTGENSVSSFAGHLPKLGEGLRGFSDKLEGINPENITAGAGAAKSLAEMADKAPKNSKKIISFGDNIITFAGKLKSYFDKTKDISKESIDTSTNAINAVKTATKDIDSKALSSAAKGINEVTKSLKDISKISEKSLKGFTKAMKELSKSNISEIAEAFNNAGSKLKSAGQAAIDELIKGIESKNKPVKEALSKIVNSVEKAILQINAYDDNFYDSGKELVLGFAQGIKDYTYRSTSAAIYMAEAADEAARKTLNINSPSKVFREIGSSVPEGFADGITKFSYYVKDSVGDMGKVAISGTNETMTKILDAINTDIDTQPRIRPVLDLTDIKSGANHINDLFNNNNIGTNLNVINAGMNARNQNGVNNDIVTSINELRKDLGSMPKGNTYNVNGVTYDDGSNIREAVETIIRAAIIERRS